MVAPKIHLRAETKPLEHRSALTPRTARALQDAGFDVQVERSSQRVFNDAEYESQGIRLVPEGCWTDQPLDTLILGLKEFPETDNFPLKHTHVTFGHVYKGQHGWQKILARFRDGGGTLLDLEFLNDPKSGRRIAAMGYHAGYAGAGLGLKTWAWMQTQKQALNGATDGSKHVHEMPGVRPYASSKAFAKEVGEDIAKVVHDVGNPPKPTVLVVGALGRCGRGAIDACREAGIPDQNILKWDLPETAKGGPFPEMLDVEVLVNCIYLSPTATDPPFITVKDLIKPGRRLQVISDVSCNLNVSNNPLPVYKAYTSFEKPSVPINIDMGVPGPELRVVSIDHFPTLLPRDASESFSGDLMVALLQLQDRHTSAIWRSSEDLFKEKIKTL